MANSPARSAIDVGSVIAGTYTIEALIGRGGMGAVFLASHNRLPGKKVAIKMLHAELSSDEVLARFKREADIASRLDHPNIVKVDDYDVLPDGTPYIRLEYLQGESLAQRLTAGPMPYDQVMSIARQVGSALAAAHRAGIVHRDLKPQNIFLVPTEVDGQSIEIAKVLDFGISKIRGSQTVQTQDSQLLGTPQYMAPEQAIGQQNAVDERTDEFALGAIVYEMLSGRPAFEGTSIPEVVFKVVYEQPRPLAEAAPSVTPQVAATIVRAMAKPSAERFPTVAEFVEALTGRPLAATRTHGSTLSPPLAATGAASATGSPGPAVKRTGNDAFAQTVGSGDHASSIGAQASSLRSAPTQATQGGIAHASSPSMIAQASPTPRKRSRALIAVGVIAALAAVAAVVYVTTRGDGKPSGDAQRVATAPVPVPAEIPPPPTPAPPPAKVETKAATPAPTPAPAPKPTKVAPPAPRPTTSPPPPVPTATSHAAQPSEADDEPGASEAANHKLKDAEDALRAGDPHKAEQLANSIINGEHVGPNQKIHAHLIRGIVACQGNDQETAQNQLRKVSRAWPKMHKRLLEACRASETPLQDE